MSFEENLIGQIIYCKTLRHFYRIVNWLINNLNALEFDFLEINNKDSLIRMKHQSLIAKRQSKYYKKSSLDKKQKLENWILFSV